MLGQRWWGIDNRWSSATCRSFQETQVYDISCAENDGSSHHFALTGRMSCLLSVARLKVLRILKYLTNTHGRLCGDRICCVRRCFRSWTTCYVTRPRQLLWYRTWVTHVSKIERNRFSTESIALEIVETDGNGLINNECRCFHNFHDCTSEILLGTFDLIPNERILKVLGRIWAMAISRLLTMNHYDM